MTHARLQSGNMLLDRLLEKDDDTARVPLRRVDLGRGDVLYPGGSSADLEHVYFPIGAVASMLVVMSDGAAVEAGAVGREGLVGSAALFGAERALERWVCQVPGEAIAVSIADFRLHFVESEGANGTLRRYTQSFMSFLAQSVACNRLHTLAERCARWLLLTSDRVGRDEFLLTQEFLAIMLGVRRSGVTVAAAALQQAGFIRYTRGLVRILDRSGLRDASCECYGVTLKEYARIFAVPPSQNAV